MTRNPLSLLIVSDTAQQDLNTKEGHEMKTSILKSAVWCTALVIAMLLLVSPTAYAAKAAKVRVGTADLTAPGGDGNYSLIAQIDDAGNVSGQWQDAFTRFGAIHMNVTCLTVVGNTAWVGGVITQSTDPSLIGLQARTKVVDGGPPNSGADTITFTFIYIGGGAPDCSAQPDFAQFPNFAGNVDIK